MLSRFEGQALSLSIFKTLQTLISNKIHLALILSLALLAFINPIRTAHWEDKILKGLGLWFKD